MLLVPTTPATPVVPHNGNRSKPAASDPVITEAPVSRPAAIVTRTPGGGVGEHLVRRIQVPVGQALWRRALLILQVVVRCQSREGVGHRPIMTAPTQQGGVPSTRPPPGAPDQLMTEVLAVIAGLLAAVS